MLQAIIIIAVGIFMALLMLETVSGCGERTYFENRTWVTGECLFIPYTSTSGRW